MQFAMKCSLSPRALNRICAACKAEVFDKTRDHYHHRHQSFGNLNRARLARQTFRWGDMVRAMKRTGYYRVKGKILHWMPTCSQWECKVKQQQLRTGEVWRKWKR
jgi:hypothetical protein